MTKEKYLDDLQEIRSIMQKSSRFISLNGLSGVLAGSYALIGAAYAYWLVEEKSKGVLVLGSTIFWQCLGILATVAILSVGTGIWLTTRKAKKNRESIWDAKTRSLLGHMLVPLLAGGLYICISLWQGRYGQSGALMLLFYGFSLVSASKFTLGYIKYLGLSEIVLGLLSVSLPGYGFWFWVLGFGVLHIVYGIAMYFKYDRISRT